MTDDPATTHTVISKIATINIIWLPPDLPLDKWPAENPSTSKNSKKKKEKKGSLKPTINTSSLLFVGAYFEPKIGGLGVKTFKQIIQSYSNYFFATVNTTICCWRNATFRNIFKYVSYRSIIKKRGLIDQYETSNTEKRHPPYLVALQKHASLPKHFELRCVGDSQAVPHIFRHLRKKKKKCKKSRNNITLIQRVPRLTINTTAVWLFTKTKTRTKATGPQDNLKLSHPLAELVKDVVISFVPLLVHQAALLQKEGQGTRPTEPPVSAVLQLDVFAFTQRRTTHIMVGFIIMMTALDAGARRHPRARWPLPPSRQRRDPAGGMFLAPFGFISPWKSLYVCCDCGIM